MLHPLDNLLVLLGTLVLAAALSGLGRLARWRGGGAAAADLAAGMGLYGIGVLLLVRLGVPLTLATGALVVAGLGAWVVALRDRFAALPRVFLLNLPLVAAAVLIPLTAWDDFSHWLPNARFLLAMDSLPGPGLPPPPSQHGTYPPGMALVTYTVARIAALIGLASLPETAAPAMTVLLFGSLAALLAPRLQGQGLSGPRAAGWGAAALALVATVWANPGFVPRLVFTNYGDAPTAVLLGVAAALALQAVERRDPWAVAQAALALAGVTNTKQTGIALAGIALAAAGLMILFERRTPRLRALGLVALAALPSLLVWALWRRHASFATGGFSVQPFAEWAWNLAPQTLGSMGRVAFSKAPFTIAMLAAATAGLLAAWRGRQTALTRACLLFGAMSFAWAATLFLCYVGTTFQELEIIRATSFWRYMTQLAGVLAVVLALALAALRDSRLAERLAPWRARAALAAALLVVALPALAARHLLPRSSEPAPPLRRVAEVLAPQLGASPVVMVVDPRAQGMTQVALAYAWHGVARVPWLGGIVYDRVSLAPDEILRRVAEAGAGFVMLCSTDEAVQAAFATPPLAPRQWRLLRREGDGWASMAAGGW